ncbi:MAG: penicillin-binding transpeptidase domain-containing protein [bacterium]
MNKRPLINPLPGPPRPLSRGRLFAVFVGMLFLAGLTVMRLIDLQVIHHSAYVERANEQYTNRRPIEPERGGVFDRRGNALVVNLPNYWSVGVRPSGVEDADVLSSQLADILHLDPSSVRSALGRKSPFVWVDRKVDPHSADLIRGLGRREIGLQRSTLRRYPFGSIGGQVIGFVNIDNVGAGGTEMRFNDILSGMPGWEVLQKDAWRREIVDPKYPRQAALDGGKVVLSIDINAQAIAEEELEEAVKVHHAAGGMIVVTRPATGEILAIASSPRFDPNDPGVVDASYRKNRAITDVFEPGSTFKVVAFAGVLEMDIADIDELIWCENGSWRTWDRTIRDTHRNGWLTARQVLSKSSNIGTAKLAGRLSPRTFYTIMRDFGFGQETSIELPGEVRGILPTPNEWSGVTQANMAMGHGIAVTALQVAMAYGAIANDGWMMKPMLVLSATDQQGRIELREPVRVRRVLSPATARTMRRLLTDAVELGTGRDAIIEGMNVAGKTGTAQKVDLEHRTYFQDRYVSSFAGFVPAEKPELLAVVVIDDPRGDHYGGTIAAPVFRDVIERLLVVVPRQEPDLEDGDLDSRQLVESHDKVPMPSLLSLSREEASVLLVSLGLHPVFEGEGGFIAMQSIPAGVDITKGTSVELTLSKADGRKSDRIKVPDVRGMALRQAVAEMTRNGLRVRVQGSGSVVGQSLNPGEMANEGSVCTLTAEPGSGVSS